MVSSRAFKLFVSTYTCVVVILGFLPCPTLRRRSGLYVAPEVVRYGRCTPASDVYAYGVLLWEVAAGVPLPELLSQPEGGAVRSWLAQQAFVPPEEAEALPAELLAWPGAEQQRMGNRVSGDGTGSGDGTNVDGDGSGLLPAGYMALAEQCLRQDPRQRPSFEDVCLRLERFFSIWGHLGRRVWWHVGRARGGCTVESARDQCARPRRKVRKGVGSELQSRWCGHTVLTGPDHACQERRTGSEAAAWGEGAKGKRARRACTCLGACWCMAPTLFAEGSECQRMF